MVPGVPLCVCTLDERHSVFPIENTGLDSLISKVLGEILSDELYILSHPGFSFKQSVKVLFSPTIKGA